MNTAPSIDPSPLLVDGRRNSSTIELDGHNTNNNDNDDDDDDATTTESTSLFTSGRNENFGGSGSQRPSRITSTAYYNSTKLYFTDLSGYFTAKFLGWLGINMCFISGGAFSLVMALSLPLFKGLGIDASRQQLYTSLITAPWAMKPFIGVASDLFPICGYNKRYFALFAILIGMMGCIALLGISSSSSYQSQSSLTNDSLTDWIVICFTAVSYEAATLDILGEGKYAELMHLHPESGSSIISYKFGLSLLGGIITQSYVGPMSDKGYFHALYWIALFLSLMPLLPTLFGWMPENKRTKDETGMVSLCGGNGNWLLFDQGSFVEKMAPFIVITLCGLSAPMLAAVTVYAQGLTVGLSFAAILLISFCTATYFIFPPSFFYIFLAIVLLQISNMNINSALSYYYTASETCVPNGPHFDYTFFITATGIVGSIMSLVSVLLFQRFFSTWRFRPAIIMTLVIGALASMIDVIIMKRWNITILGIPDKVFFMFGNTIFGSIVGTLQSIPFSALYAKIAPPGMESAVFAYTVGIANFCNIVNSLVGSGVITMSGMKTVGDNCDFKALPGLVVITQIIIPIVIGVPAMFLIPNVLQTERLIDWDHEGWYSASTERRSNGDNDDDEAIRFGLLNDAIGEDEQDNRPEPQLGMLL